MQLKKAKFLKISLHHTQKQKTNDKVDERWTELGLSEIENNLNGADYIKHKDDIQSNRNHLNSLKNKSSSEWREYATQCMIEI